MGWLVNFCGASMRYSARRIRGKRMIGKARVGGDSSSVFFVVRYFDWM